MTIIIGVQRKPETKAAQLAEKEGVDIRLYNIIVRGYRERQESARGNAGTDYQEKIMGRAEVRPDIFSIAPRHHCRLYVIDGVISAK